MTLSPEQRLAFDHGLIGTALIMTASVFAMCWAGGKIATDFGQSFWVAGSLVRHGISPYSWSRAQILAGQSFPYPAPAALLFAALSLIPQALSDPLVAAACLGACVGSLALLSVRDFRVYALVLLWLPVVSGWQSGNFSLPLVLGLAATWRYRDRAQAAGLAAGLAIAIKPIVWPLMLWMLLTGRRRAATHALSWVVGLNLVAWLVLGPHEAGQWLHLLAQQGKLVFRGSYALSALFEHLGAGHAIGQTLQALVALILMVECVRRRGAANECQLLALIVLLMLVSSPQVDNHYFALMLVPMAVTRPTVSWIWAAPLALWLCGNAPLSLAEMLLFWCVVVGISGWLVGARAGRRSDPVRSLPGDLLSVPPDG